MEVPEKAWEHRIYEERLRELAFFSQNRIRLRKILQLCKYLKGGW